MKRNRLICLVVLYSIFLTSLIKIAPAQDDAPTDEKPKGLLFRLRAGEGKNAARDAPQNVQAAKLSAAETDAILRRLPPMETPAEPTDFAMRPASLPPPKTGKTIALKFPADNKQTAPTAATTGELRVLRASPNSAASFVTDLSVTFSQPMIAVTSQKKASETVPVRLSPEVAGKWRWLGTNTLIFDAARRFPMATRYTATIPAGTRSVSGAVLEKDFSWTFETPPAKVESFLQSEKTLRREAILLAKFNQKINPADVLPKISLTTVEGQKIAVRIAEKSEIARDQEISQAVKNFPAEQWIAFRAVEPLPVGSRFNLVFEAGVPSAEGVVTGTLPQNFVFQTFDRLKLQRHFCNYNSEARGCKAYDDLRLEFNNRIDAENFDESLVVIEPKIDNPDIAVNGDEIVISGCCRNPRTTYKVTISGALKDEFGQTLGDDAAVKFEIGADDANLTTNANGGFITLDPNARRVFSVYAKNYSKLNVQLFAVKPEDYGVFHGYLRADGNQPPRIGRLIYQKTVKVKAERDTFGETKIDLNPALVNGVGQAVLFVEPAIDRSRADYENVAVWLQATNIALDAFADYENLRVYASDLKNGKPLKNVRLRMSGNTPDEAATDENGLAKLVAPPQNSSMNWLIAQSGADSAILFDGNGYYSSGIVVPETTPESLRWYVFDDRQMYRPGETVSVKGYVRRIAGGKRADVEPLGDAASDLRYVLRDSVGNEIMRGKADLNAFGAFDFQLQLPENINLGYEKIEFAVESTLANRTHTHFFQAQEFRRPEFEVTAKNENAAPFFVGSSATVSVEAKYYAGGGLANAATNWRVTSTPTVYTPPNRDDFTFGKWTAWWSDDDGDDREEETTRTLAGVTDANGRNFLAIDFDAAGSPRPFSVKAEARVQDVNRQTFAASTTLLVHPSDLYVGLRTEKFFVAKGEKFRVETITTDIDGNAVADAPVALVGELKDWQQIKGEWQQVTIDTQTCQLKSANSAAACDFVAKQGGRFVVKATVTDTKQRRSESELEVWIAGGTRAPSRDVEKETVELIPGKEEYAPGEVAEILVNAPFYPAEGILTLRRGGIVKTERLTMTEASTVLKIPVEERFVPNLHAQVDLFGAARRIYFEDENDAKLPKRPAFASGALNLQVSTASRELKVAAEAQEKTLAPGGETVINVAVADHRGNPSANTEVAVVAVDESVLALTNYRISNPLNVFYPQIESRTADFYSRGNVMLANPEDLLGVKENFNSTELSGYGRGSGNGEGDGMGGGVGMGGKNPPAIYKDWLKKDVAYIVTEKEKNQIRIRRNFDALAIFSPSVRTDKDGRAAIKINLPDNLTRYRITAVAGDGAKKFGVAESALTARQDLMIRPSAPRFINLGDRAELPVVLQNQTNAPLTVDVAIRAANANLTDGDGRRLTIAPNDRAEIRFPVTGAKNGVARFQVGAVSGALADAAEFAFPVLTPAATEAFATYGTTDQSGAIVQTVAAPDDVFPQFGGLEITTSSTQLQELTDAFIYLLSYPFECSEQISSRILSVAALRDVLQEFKAKDTPSASRIEAKMTADIKRLRELQHGDGGFSFWSSKDRSLPYLTVHVAHALARAQAKGYDVPTAMTQSLLNYLRIIEGKYPAVYDTQTRRAISAYALYVREMMGDRDAAKARRLLSENAAENLSPETLGWILSVLAGDKDSAAQVESIKRHLLNRVAETANAAHFVTDYKDGEYVLLSSDRRADGVILEAFLKIRGSEANVQAAEFEDLIPKLARGLLDGRTRGRWRNTQENAFVLLALDKFFQTFEKLTPNFVARVWLGQNFAGEQKFAGRSTDSNAINIPMQVLQQNKAAQNLILDKQGDGRLYYRVGLKYAPQNLNLDAADYGFTVSRSYEAIDDTQDVRQNADGSWTIKSGARIRVRLQMVAPTRRYHVALVDNLPAGFEIVNANLAVTENLPDDPKEPEVRYSYGYFSRWYDHENLRDDRAEIFKDLLYEGVWDYSYVARATTPGNFTAPPAKAEEMYAPENFGRSRTDFVSVE